MSVITHKQEFYIVNEEIKAPTLIIFVHNNKIQKMSVLQK